MPRSRRTKPQQLELIRTPTTASEVTPAESELPAASKTELLRALSELIRSAAAGGDGGRHE